MSLTRWADPDFRDRLTTWVADRLAERSARLVGVGEQPHSRTWSTALRFDTTLGPVWAKANGTGTRHEPGLLALLQERVPGLTPEVLAVDVTQGWSLCRDGGPLLRALAPPQRIWAEWEVVVGRYAEAQIALAGEREGVLATGVREVSPSTVPDLARSLVRELAAVPVDEGGLTAAQADALAARLPDLDAWCAELAGSGVPDSVQHDDLHSANVCWDGTPSHRPHVIDWGDTTWGHPLSTMLGTLNSVAFHAGQYADDRPADTAELRRVRDAYLEPFTAYAARDDLVHWVDLARRTGSVGKALTYRAVLADEPVSAHADLDFPVRDWLLDLAA